MEVMLITTKLRIILITLKTKHLWKQIQTYLKIHKTFTANPRILKFWKSILKRGTITGSCWIWTFDSYSIWRSCYKGTTKKSIITDVINFTESSTKSLPFEKHCNDIYSIPLIRQHHDSYLNSNLSRIYESCYTDEPFTVVFNSVENLNIGIFSETKKARHFRLPIPDVFVIFYEYTARN